MGVRSVAKSNLPTKLCVVCGRPFAWRKKWEKVWDEVNGGLMPLGLLFLFFSPMIAVKLRTQKVNLH